MKPRLRLLHLAAGAALLAAFGLPLPAQTKGAAPSAQEQKERAARGEVLLDQSSGGPDLVSGPNGEPILRYPVAHQHAATDCVGWLYISRDTMRYEVLAPEQDKGHAFELRLSDLTAAQQWRLGGSSLPEAEFRFADGAIYHFFHLRNRVVQTRNASFSWGDVLSFQDLVDGAKNFDNIVATLKGGAAPFASTAPLPPTKVSRPEAPEPAAGSEIRKTSAGSHPLTLDEVEAALGGALPKASITDLANQYGVDFKMTDAAERRLRSAGADSALLLDLVKAYRGPSRTRPAAAAPPGRQPAPPPAASFAQAAPAVTPSPAPAAPPAAQAAPPPLPKPLPPPVVQITEPAGVEEGKSVEAAGNVLRGRATHGNGISAVLVNDRLASLKTLSPTSSQFEFSDLSLNEGWTPLTVVARSTDGSMSWLSFKLSRPAVRWLNPPNGVIETASTAILAQGEAVGFNGVDKVELAGTSLNLEKLAGGAVEFHTILPLVLGQNTFQGTVVGSSGFRLAFKLEVRRMAASTQDSNQK